MTLADRLMDAQTRAMRLYLRRQELQGQAQMVAQQAQACDLALVKTDGEIETLQALMAAEQEATRGV